MFCHCLFFYFLSQQLQYRKPESGKVKKETHKGLPDDQTRTTAGGMERTEKKCGSVTLKRFIVNRATAGRNNLDLAKANFGCLCKYYGLLTSGCCPMEANRQPSMLTLCLCRTSDSSSTPNTEAAPRLNQATYRHGGARHLPRVANCHVRCKIKALICNELIRDLFVLYSKYRSLLAKPKSENSAGQDRSQEVSRF